ncbi:MAG: hypothetical protein WB992_02910 [Bryobacteraceae bacterium]
MLIGLARFSAQLNSWQSRHDAPADIEAARQMLPTYYPAIAQLVSMRRDRVVFSRINMLYVARQAFMACDSAGAKVTKTPDVEQIMKCCLMANDLLLVGRQPTSQDEPIEKAASLLPFSNYLPHPGDPLRIARNLIFLDEIAPKLAGRRDFRDLAAEFRAARGLTPQAFCEIVYCTATKFITNLVEQNNPAGLILTEAYFRNTKLSSIAGQFLAEQSIGILELQTKVRNYNAPDGDFLPFQQHPLVEFRPGEYFCMSPKPSVTPVARSSAARYLKESRIRCLHNGASYLNSPPHSSETWGRSSSPLRLSSRSAVPIC